MAQNLKIMNAGLNVSFMFFKLARYNNFCQVSGLKLEQELHKLLFCCNDLWQYNSCGRTVIWRGALFGCAACINTAVSEKHTPFPTITAGPGGSLNSEQWQIVAWGKRRVFFNILKVIKMYSQLMTFSFSLELVVQLLL